MILNFKFYNISNSIVNYKSCKMALI